MATVHATLCANDALRECQQCLSEDYLRKPYCSQMRPTYSVQGIWHFSSFYFSKTKLLRNKSLISVVEKKKKLFSFWYKWSRYHIVRDNNLCSCIRFESCRDIDNQPIKLNRSNPSINFNLLISCRVCIEFMGCTKSYEH